MQKGDQVYAKSSSDNLLNQKVLSIFAPLFDGNKINDLATRRDS
jgi:hypothetical protein